MWQEAGCWRGLRDLVVASQKEREETAHAERSLGGGKGPEKVIIQMNKTF